MNGIYLYFVNKHNPFGRYWDFKVEVMVLTKSGQRCTHEHTYTEQSLRRPSLVHHRQARQKCVNSLPDDKLLTLSQMTNLRLPQFGTNCRRHFET